MTESYVLFVEDSILCSLETGEVLRDHGFNVLSATSAAEAFGTIDGDDHLLALVTDVDLGQGADGFEVARRARAAYPDLPVVYVSGTAAGRHPAEGVGGSEFVPKPYRRQRIVEALNRVICFEAARKAAARARRAASGRTTADDILVGLTDLGSLFTVRTATA